MQTLLASSDSVDPGLPPGSRRLLTASLLLGLSILYQVYIFDFQQGVLTGGETSRLLLKIVASLMLTVSLRSYLSIAAFALNLPLKLPLLFVAATIAVLTPYLSTEFKQALNLVFFLPILFVDWNRPSAPGLFRRIWTLIVAIVAVQLILDPPCKLYFHVGWDNAAVIGGMGNPNVFGIFLICSGLACIFLVKSRWRFASVPLLLATLATGSLASSLVGALCLMGQLARYIRRAPVRGLIVLAIMIAVLTASTIAFEIVTDSPSITHAFYKFQGLQQLLSGGSTPDSDTFRIRIQYLRDGLGMLADSPASIILGHPDATAMYNGDGLWTSFIVTYGLPVTLAFLATNLYVLHRALRVRSPESLMSGAVVLAMLAFFITNRILDYWPAALLYLLAFSYLTNRGFRPRSVAESPAALGIEGVTRR